jgi:hypothetical protein
MGLKVGGRGAAHVKPPTSPCLNEIKGRSYLFASSSARLICCIASVIAKPSFDCLSCAGVAWFKSSILNASAGVRACNRSSFSLSGNSSESMISRTFPSMVMVQLWGRLLSYYPFSAVTFFAKTGSIYSKKRARSFSGKSIDRPLKFTIARLSGFRISEW